MSLGICPLVIRKIRRNILTDQDPVKGYSNGALVHWGRVPIVRLKDPMARLKGSHHHWRACMCASRGVHYNMGSRLGIVGIPYYMGLLMSGVDLVALLGSVVDLAVLGGLDGALGGQLRMGVIWRRGRRYVTFYHLPCSYNLLTLLALLPHHPFILAATSNLLPNFHHQHQ